MSLDKIFDLTAGVHSYFYNRKDKQKKGCGGGGVADLTAFNPSTTAETFSPTVIPNRLEKKG